MENLELVEVCAVTPDLLCVVETETGYPIVCEDLAFGQRASVLAFPSPLFFREEHALRVVGPEAFGLKGISYQPLPTDYVLGPSVFARRHK